MNIKSRMLQATLMILILIPEALAASDKPAVTSLNTDWLQATLGSSGQLLGTEVIEIK